MQRKELMFITVVFAVLLAAFIVGKSGITGNIVYETTGLKLLVEEVDYFPGEYFEGQFIVNQENEGQQFKIYVDNELVLQGTAERVNKIRFLVPGEVGLYTLRVGIAGKETRMNFDVIV